jgi:hypothetical protein
MVHPKNRKGSCLLALGKPKRDGGSTSETRSSWDTMPSYPIPLSIGIECSPSISQTVGMDQMDAHDFGDLALIFDNPSWSAPLGSSWATDNYHHHCYVPILGVLA